MRQLFTDPALQEQFLPAGYVQVPLLSASEVSYLLTKIGTLRPDDNFNPQSGENYRATYHCSFVDKNVAYKRQAFALMKEVFEPHLKRYMPDFEIISANFYVKPPHTGRFTIHQNWPVLDVKDTTVTLWCPLQDVDVHNGGIHVVPGSHKIIDHVEGILCPPYFKDFQEALIEKYLKPLPMQAGQGLIFDDALIHWSPTNNSDEPRIAVQILCVPGDATPFLYFLDQNHPERFEKIEAGPEFFLSHTVTDLTVRQPHWKSLGFVENNNRYIAEQEFVDLLKKGDEIRRKIYFPHPTPVFRDRELEEKFQEDGYVVVPLLTAEEVQSLLEIHDSLTGDIPADYYATIFHPDREHRREVGRLIDAILQPRVLPLLAGYKRIASAFISKRGSTKQGRVNVHQDYSFVDQSRVTGVHVWIPLVDVDEDNGCLTVYPGTHFLVNHISAIPWNGSPFQSVLPVLERECGVRLPMAAGSALIYNERTLHGSGENSTPGKRVAVASAYIPVAETMRVYVCDPAEPHRLEILSVQDSADLQLIPGKPIPQPYADTLARIGTINYQLTMLTEEQIQHLRVSRKSKHSDESLRNTENVPTAVPAMPAPTVAEPGKGGGLVGWLRKMLGGARNA